MKRELEEEFKEAIRLKAVVEIVQKGLITEIKEKVVDLRKME